MTEEVEMGKDSQIRLAKINKDSDMKDRIWAEITETDLIVIDQPMKKGMNGNTKPLVEVIFEDN